MKKILRILSILVGAIVLAGVGTFTWASLRVSSLRSEIVETHAADFPIPFPLSAEERAALPAGADPVEVAHERAIERGAHLMTARYGCTECHGADLAGGVLLEDPLIGTILGPNITTGSGSKTLDYDATDWDRAVRHGVRADGTRSTMPSVDFMLMSDQELSDIISFIRTYPPVDAQVADVRLGPLGIFLAATGPLSFSADVIESHQTAHPALPPNSAISIEFGRHLAGVCVGCHGQNLAGGPIRGGDPSWPPAGNLTPHVDGLAGWTLADFRRVLLEATRPDGTSIQVPMDGMVGFGQNMTEVELEALWMYLRSLPPVTTPE